MSDWVVVHQAYMEGIHSPFWSDVVSDAHVLQRRIKEDAAQGTISADAAIFGLHVIDRVLAMPEVAVTEARMRAKEAGLDGDLDTPLSDLESFVPSSLL